MQLLFFQKDEKRDTTDHGAHQRKLHALQNERDRQLDAISEVDKTLKDFLEKMNAESSSH